MNVQIFQNCQYMKSLNATPRPPYECVPYGTGQKGGGGGVGSTFSDFCRRREAHRPYTHVGGVGMKYALPTSPPAQGGASCPIYPWKMCFLGGK